jgi:hypothetical protein
MRASFWAESRVHRQRWARLFHLRSDSAFIVNLQACVIISFICIRISKRLVALGGLVVIVVAIDSKFRGFKTGRGRWLFNGDKRPQYDFLRRGSKVVGPVS